MIHELHYKDVYDTLELTLKQTKKSKQKNIYFKQMRLKIKNNKKKKKNYTLEFCERGGKVVFRLFVLDALNLDCIVSLIFSFFSPSSMRFFNFLS